VNEASNSNLPVDMSDTKTVFVINGSASRSSANGQVIATFCSLTNDRFRFRIFDDLRTIPHFDPERTTENVPAAVAAFRDAVQHADGILICTPEYVFSIPSGLKNAIEWCVSTTVFSDKPIGLITASAAGQKGHEELQLIMKTLMTRFTEKTTLLISGVRGKVSAQGEFTDPKTLQDLVDFVDAFTAQMDEVH
jgi:NAD(P)H-dependent FMN reductase